MMEMSPRGSAGAGGEPERGTGGSGSGLGGCCVGSPVTQGWLLGMDASFREAELSGQGVWFILILTICCRILFWVDRAAFPLLGQGKNDVWFEPI